MGALVRVIRAETSSDLKQKEHACDVDTLRVIAFAGIRNPGHLSVFRLKYLGDAESLAGARNQFFQWTCCAASLHNRAIRWSKEISVRALEHWVAGDCEACRGVKYIKLDGAPVLSNIRCHVCNGTGKKLIRKDFLIIKDVLGKADLVVRGIERRVSHRLGIDRRM